MSPKPCRALSGTLPPPFLSGFRDAAAARSYPLTPPIITPLMKYFCASGYTNRIGTVEMTVRRYVGGVSTESTRSG